MASVIEKEMKEIARIIAGLHRSSEENASDLDKQLEEVTKIFDDFNRKYPKLMLKIDKNIDSLFVRIFINEPSVKKVFDDVASKIKGLTGVGLNSFDEATIQEADKFNALVNKIADRVCLTYSLDTGSETIQLEFNGKEQMVEMIYEIKSIVNSMTPQFQFIAEYAGRQKDDSIKILENCYQLGFIDIEDEALFKWEDEFYPKMWE